MFKVYIKQVKDGAFIGKSRLVKDYENLNAAVKAGRKNLLTNESTFCVREYDDTKRVNIMTDDEQDTGTRVVNYGR